jgi:hypothetical protein
MDRRKFISGSLLFTSGCLASGRNYGFSLASLNGEGLKPDLGLYDFFRDPDLKYRPFIRWWWNGNKVEADELIRELHIMKAAGLGGVEINPVQFPERFEGDDLGKPSLEWLRPEWIKMLQSVFEEAKRTGMTCDLIVGSGWPFGAEDLKGEELSQVVVIAVKKIKGPQTYEISREEIFIEADPKVSSPYPGRTMELLSLTLVPDPVTSVDEAIDLSDMADNEFISVTVPGGDHALYGLVKVTGFMEVINGAPGASGPVLNHYNEDAVRKYLYKMSDTIEAQAGPLSQYIRALFTDSMELEGANWSSDMNDEFRKRRGYDIFPYLPFVLFRTGAMGNITDFKYGAVMSPGFEADIRRIRYDFELTKAELLEERFLRTFAAWCNKLGVKSRMQAYGRSFFPLESSFAVDIPECESWTMNWLKHRVGEEMPEEDYRRGRAYTMINKYVSSAAHLSGKRLISCEEMTDTYTVFNTSLENLKIGGDQTAVSGVTHSVFHGFNYSPPEAPWPGWIRYGGYFNENNTWWSYFHFYNEYKGRMSSLLQNSVMYADIAILPPLGDMWSIMGAQTEPFPSITHIEYMTLVWEAINKNGSGCDYVSERVIGDSVMSDGYMHYGPRKYHTLFLVGVESINRATAGKLYDFVLAGGRIFCIETVPVKSLGWKDHTGLDNEVTDLVEKMRSFPERLILLKKPEKDFIGWYKNIQEKYCITPYVRFENPDAYVMQIRYQADDGAEIIYLINSNLHRSYKTRITFSGIITGNRYGSVWDPECGERYRLLLSHDGSLNLDMGPGDSLLFVFNREKRGLPWHPLPPQGTDAMILDSGWTAEFRHCRESPVKTVTMEQLKDLKDLPEFVHFSGTVVYRNTFSADSRKFQFLNLGKVYGVSVVKINGRECGVRWYGRRIYPVTDFLVPGKNTVEVSVVTSMGNYMKSLTDNPIAQYWTNEKNKNQPLQSMGLTGPVTLYGG